VTAHSRARLTLAPQTASAGLARRWLAEQLSGYDVDIAETALLLTSEVVTNAVLHARTPIDLAVQVAPGRVRIEVADRSPVLPMTKHYDTSAETGRGLVLLAALASDWGVEAAPGGKVVWFDVADGRDGTEAVVDRAQIAPMESPLDAWPELAEGPAAPPDMGNDALVDIRILRLPVQVLRRAAEHGDALLREFRLILERRPGEGRAIPGQLLALVDELAGRYSGFNAGADAELQLAYERGAEWIDLSYRLPPEAGAAAARLDALYDEADAYCRAGEDLLTLAAPRDAVAVRKWFLREFSRQAAGEPPQPWPDSPWFIPRAVGELQVEEVRRGPSVTLELSGDLDVHTAPSLRDRLVGLVAAGQADLVVDLSRLSFIDSTGIGVLVGGLKRCRAQQGDLQIRAANPEILAVLGVTGLDELFLIVPQEGP
jgi:anti-anti-sigma factor